MTGIDSSLNKSFGGYRTTTIAEEVAMGLFQDPGPTVMPRRSEDSEMEDDWDQQMETEQSDETDLQQFGNCVQFSSAMTASTRPVQATDSNVDWWDCHEIVDTSNTNGTFGVVESDSSVYTSERIESDDEAENEECLLWALEERPPGYLEPCQRRDLPQYDRSLPPKAYKRDEDGMKIFDDDWGTAGKTEEGQRKRLKKM